MEFVYRAVTKGGKEKKGNIEADDEIRAAAKIKAMGLVPLEVAQATFWTRELSFNFGAAVKPRELAVFCRQFVSMLQAGIGITDCLTMLAEQTENKALARAIRQVENDIEKGESLSIALKKHPKIFPSIMISMVTAGEASGRLETSLSRASEHFEKDAKVRGMMKKAATYPIVVAVVAVVVVVIMLVTVIPSYTEMFEDMNIEMPKITQVVINMSEFVQSYWYMLIIVIGGVVAALRMFGKTEEGEKLFGTLSRSIPILGVLTIKTQASVFSRTLSTLLASGIAMTDALEIVARTMTNALYRDALKNCKEEVEKGVPLSEPLETCELFPPMVSHMVRVGEETGEIEEMLDRLANYYDEEVEQATQTAMAALEPMIILVMAAVVIVLVAAVMSPMMAMYSGIDNL